MIFKTKKHSSDLYSTLLVLSRNIFFYKTLKLADNFETRIYLMFFHFSIMLTIFKDLKIKFHQNNYDSLFYNIENNLRELGFGDVSVNKKMKEYVNMFYAILDKIEVTDMSIDENIANFFRKIFNLDKNIKFYANYYKKYNEYLSNNTLNNFTKDIINHNF